MLQSHRVSGVLRLPEFLDNRYLKVAMSALRPGRLYALVLISVRG